MREKKYNWEIGHAFESHPEQCSILLESGYTVWAIDETGSMRFKSDERVAVAWYSPYRYPPERSGLRRVSAHAVEPLGKWARESSYRTRFSKHSRTEPGLFAETLVLVSLQRTGMRAEESTDYEDEKLNVDIWIFALYTGQWQWLPLDIGLVQHNGRDDRYQKKYTEKKRKKCLESCTIPVFVTNESVFKGTGDNSRALAASIETQAVSFLAELNARRKKLLTRESALEKEQTLYSFLPSPLKIELQRALHLV